MKPVIAVVILSVVCMTSSNAWLFFRRYPSAKAKGKPVDSNCEQLAKEGSCEFYSCFEKRLPCGRNWYNEKYGLPYCKDFKAFQHTFTEKGQKFVNGTLQCMGEELISWYQKDTMNCHDFTHAAFKALSRCYIRHGFCEVVYTDAGNLINVYRPEHLFQRGALKIWREMFRMAYQCEPEYFKDVGILLLTAIKNYDN